MGHAMSTAKPPPRRHALPALLCLLVHLASVDGATKPRCTADERLCPIEYGSTRFICVDRDSVFNCGGCSANGSGQNCELIDAAAVGCSRDGQCMACNWMNGGYDPQGYDDELVCEVAERQPFSPPAKRQDLVQAVKAPTFVHQISGRQTPNSPFYFGPTTEKTKRNPVARMADAAPWAAARPGRPGGRPPPIAEGDGSPKGAKAGAGNAARPPTLAEAVPAQAPFRAAPKVDGGLQANRPPVGAGFPVFDDTEEFPAFSDYDEDFDEWDDEDDYDTGLVLGGHPAGPKLQKAQGVDGVTPKKPLLVGGALQSFPRWLQDGLNTVDTAFESEADLLVWLRQVNAARPRTPAQARKRTNAERFALDLPPLPPVNQHKKERPGDEERQRQRERRMELEELRAKAELQAFREGRDPDEAIAAVRLPPPIDEKREKEINEAVDRAVSFKTFDELPSDLAASLRRLLARPVLPDPLAAPAPLAAPRAGGLQHVLAGPAGARVAVDVDAADFEDGWALSGGETLDDDDVDELDESFDTSVKRPGPLAAKQRKPAEEDDEDDEDAEELGRSPAEALLKDDAPQLLAKGVPPAPAPKAGAPPAGRRPRPAPKQKDAAAAAAKDEPARAGKAAAVDPAAPALRGNWQPPMQKQGAVPAAGKAGEQKQRPVVDTKQGAGGLAEHHAAAIAMGQPFVKAMQDALGPEAWDTFLAALQANGGLPFAASQPPPASSSTTDDDDDIAPPPPARKAPGAPPAAGAKAPVPAGRQQPFRAEGAAAGRQPPVVKAPGPEAPQPRVRPPSPVIVDDDDDVDDGEEEAPGPLAPAAARQIRPPLDAKAAANAAFQEAQAQARARQQQRQAEAAARQVPVQEAPRPARFAGAKAEAVAGQRRGAIPVQQQQQAPKPARFDAGGDAAAAADALAYEAHLGRQGKAHAPI